jgi:hypothetical protein
MDFTRSDDFTLEIWFKLVSIDARDVLFQRGDLSGARISLHIEDGAFVGEVYSSGSSGTTLTSSTGLLTTGEWYHVALVRDVGHSLTLFVDGAEADSSTDGAGSLWWDELRRFALGRQQAGSYYANVYLSEARVWDVARSAAEINDTWDVVLSGSESGLAGYWSFTESSGSIANDLTGHGADGSLIGGATWSTVSDLCRTDTEELVCTIVTESTDDDGDAIDYTFEWDVDGSAYTDTETTTWDDDTVPGDALGDDETWTCTVTPDDGEDNGDPGSDSYYIETESTVCTADLEFSVDGSVVHTYAHELDALPSSLNPHYYINATTWTGHANMDLDDLLVSDSDSGVTLISNDFSSGSGWSFSSGGSGSATISGGQGHATADWNGLTLSTSTPPVAHLEYTTAIRTASSSGRLFYDLLDETADAWLRVHLCPRPDSMTCAAGDASSVGMDPSMGWVCSKVGDSESGCESITSSPWTTGTWQDVTVSIDFSSACGL